MQNILSEKHINKYPETTKEFAATLLFYSNAAYEYVRKTFLNKLPHPRTIRKWFSTSNFNPGISIQIIKSIKSAIDKNEKNGKILQFGIQADDMSIKKSIEWDGQQYYGLVDIGMDRINNNDFSDREATYVFVIMLVALNAHFKTPISFYFIRSLTAEERANIITNNLIILSDNPDSTGRIN